MCTKFGRNIVGEFALLMWFDFVYACAEMETMNYVCCNMKLCMKIEMQPFSFTTFLSKYLQKYKKSLSFAFKKSS